jgi:two-component system response regulator YesN
MRGYIKNTVEKVKIILDERDNSRSVIYKVKHYIAQNLEQELTNEKIAAQVYLNPVYLNRIFKKETGLTMSDYIQKERIEKARKLLEKTEMPVGVVAMHVGYSNFSHFSRMFRRQTGLSPQNYRKKFK